MKKKVLAFALAVSLIFVQGVSVYCADESFSAGEEVQECFEDENSETKEGNLSENPLDNVFCGDASEFGDDSQDFVLSEKNVVSWEWSLSQTNGGNPIVNYNDSLGEWQIFLKEKEEGYSQEEVKSLLPKAIDASIENEEGIRQINIVNWNILNKESQSESSNTEENKYIFQAELEEGYYLDQAEIAVYIDHSEMTGSVVAMEEEAAFSSNGAFNSANSIFVNQAYSSHLGSSSDEKYYKFNLMKDGYISLSFKHGYVDNEHTFWHANLYNSNYDWMMEREYTGKNVAFVTSSNVGLPAGTYYLKITADSWNYSDVSYQFKVNYKVSTSWETEFNDNFNTADQISTGCVINGSLMNSSNEDYFKFNLPKRGCISITFKHEYVDNGHSFWHIDLYNGNYEWMMEREYSGKNVASVTSTKVGLPAGTYYLKITSDSWNYSDVPYQFKVNYAASSSWETEFNDKFTTADQISTGYVINGSIMNSSNEDYFKFTLPQKGYVSLTFKHDYVDNGHTFWHAALYNGNYEWMMERKYKGNSTAPVTSTRVGLSAGTYYLKITSDSWNYSDVPYKFKVNYVASSSWETEFNDSFSTTDSISVGTIVHGSLMSSDDCDYYKIKIPSSGKYRLVFDHSYVDSSNTYWEAQLYNSYKEAFSERYCFQGNKTRSIKGPQYFKKGTYYFKVYHNYNYCDGQYAFILEHYPHTHMYTTTVKKATLSKNGLITKKCFCGKKYQTVIYRPKTVSLSTSVYKYDGKNHRPSVKIIGSNKKVISPSNYTVKYPKDVKNPGKHTIQIVFKKYYSGTINKSYSIVKK